MSVNRPSAGMELLGALVRWGLGALFIYMGLNKALHPVDFLKLVREYDVVSTPLLLNAIAAGLPWFEVFCGALLVAGVAVRGSALLLAAMLLPFSVLVLHRALGIAEAEQIALCAVKFDCGCGTGEILICRKLVENALLFAASMWLTLSGRGRVLALRYSWLQAGEQPTEIAPGPTAYDNANSSL